MKLLINIIAIIVVAVVIGFQFNRTKNLYNKKYDENKNNILIKLPIIQFMNNMQKRKNTMMVLLLNTIN